MPHVANQAVRSPLELYARDRIAGLKAIVEALATLSYDVHVRYVDNCGNASRGPKSQATVFYLDGETWPKGVRPCANPASSSINPSIVIAEACAVERAIDYLRASPDFVIWPCTIGELGIRLKRALPTNSGRLGEEDKRLRAEFAALGLIGQSPVFLSMLRLTKVAAACDAPTLIHGETGTGKELVAKAIHHMGPRTKRPFVPVNCGALPDSLVENELFGHELGAFTDARKAQSGLVAQASGGTIFLDEIESLSLRGQAALLRFLEDFRYRPLGGNRIARSDVKVIAATNVDLNGLARVGAFRTDLLYRLDVLSLALPPLRDRPDDIDLLAAHFITQLGTKYGQPPKRLRPHAREWLVNYSWPGNVRELENLIHRSLITSSGPDLDIFGAHSIHTASSGTGMLLNGYGSDQFTTFHEAKTRFLTEFEREYLTKVMEKTGGNVTQAARLAGKERRALGKLLRKHAMAGRDYVNR